MKKIGYFIIILYLILVAFGCKSVHFRERFKTETVILTPEVTTSLYGIDLTADFSKSSADYDLIAESIPMKPGYWNYKPIPIYEEMKWSPKSKVILVRDDNNIIQKNYTQVGSFYPIMNLDIYGLDGSKKRIAIHDYSVEVIINIPYEKILKSNPDFDRNSHNLYLLDADTGKWEILEKIEKGIEDIQHKADLYYQFRINKWPKDDKMICSGT